MSLLSLTVREIALSQPTSIRVFEKFGIDYCCGGKKPLAEACEAARIDAATLLAALDEAAKATDQPARDWSGASLTELINHIVATHHNYVKSELPRLAVLAQKVVSRHGDTQAHLPAMQGALAALDGELTPHLFKEENILFPYIAQLEQALTSHAAHPTACFGTVTNPIAAMTAEHDAAGEILRTLRQLSNEYTTPVGACPTYLAYYDGLQQFERDLHQHIHLENNILFPRAVALEAREMATR